MLLYGSETSIQEIPKLKHVVSQKHLIAAWSKQGINIENAQNNYTEKVIEGSKQSLQKQHRTLLGRHNESIFW